MTAATTRDDLASVVTALKDSALEQRRWQAEYEAKAAQLDGANRALFERFAAQARGSATAYEVSADMLKRYVTGASHD
jgi:hypothetical protein